MVGIGCSWALNLEHSGLATETLPPAHCRLHSSDIYSLLDHYCYEHVMSLPSNVHLMIGKRVLQSEASSISEDSSLRLFMSYNTKGDPFLLPKPLSYLKSEIKSASLSIWQDNWDNGETGRSTHDIVPGVSNKPVGWNREEIMFVTGDGPFPSYLHRFSLRTHDNCS
ncbi:hypothetical protein AVEN_218447-1 [Araneus ventricosus]|uniref:Uncharacterized protein n=1 Tax=Araneus ventricosus TaxID=182803 RepID=A0A4Y2KXP3_ARAVE|nr:hypothetical protein AVEN_218447-1 [Araneus ventricosus]